MNDLDQGNAAFNAGDMALAEQHFNRVLADDPDQTDALHGLGAVAWMRGDLPHAVEFVERAVSLAPQSASYRNTLGEIYRMAAEWAKAEESLAHALQIDPALASARHNLGMVYLSRRLFSRAALEFSHALQQNPDAPMTWYNLGIAFKEMNQLDEAIAAYRRAVELNPVFVEAHLNLALALLLDGQWSEGFQEYEWRLEQNFTPARHFDRPRWDGLVDPDGTLLVYAEQGLGDALHFARYIPFIAREEMKVIVQCHPNLGGIMGSVEGVSAVYGFDQELPDYSARFPLMSLPLLFQTRLDRVPGNVPYVFPPDDKIAAWGERLAAVGDTIRIGLRWKGNPQQMVDAARSCPLALFEVLAGIPRVTWVSLHNEPLEAEERASAQRLGLVDVSAELRDFDDTAALIANLDLVVSVDTAVLHLAGAMGRPAWALLPFSPDWRWLLDREDSVWYPTLRLFRQQRPDDWEPVLERVAAQLGEVMRSIEM